MRCRPSTRMTLRGLESSGAIRGVDAADFTIDSAGVLSFVSSPPDFENPTDRAQTAVCGDLNDNGDMRPTPARQSRRLTGDDNQYQITVSATEVWNGSDESLPAKRSDLDVTVSVQRRGRPGELTLEWLQPEVGVDDRRHPDRRGRHHITPTAVSTLTDTVTDS